MSQQPPYGQPPQYPPSGNQPPSQGYPPPYGTPPGRQVYPQQYSPQYPHVGSQPPMPTAGAPLLIVRHSWLYFCINIFWWALCIATLGIGFIATFLFWRRNRLEIYADRIVHVSGFVTINERSIPMTFIQDVTLKRVLGFSRITIETAGGTSHDEFGWFRGGLGVRDLIYQQMRTVRTQG